MAFFFSKKPASLEQELAAVDGNAATTPNAPSGAG